MGSYLILIEGKGQWNNKGDLKDADVIYKSLVNELIAAGQQIDSAKFISPGYVIDLTPATSPAKKGGN